MARRACAFFPPRRDPGVDRGTGHQDPGGSPQVPAGRAGGHAVLDHPPHRQSDHAMGGVTAWGCQMGQGRMAGRATRGAVMRRRGDHAIPRPPQVEMAHVVPRPLGLRVPRGHVTTTRTRVPRVRAAGGNPLGLGQVGHRGHPCAGIGSRRPWTTPGFALLVPMLGPKLSDQGSSGAIPKPGKDAIVSN